MNYVEILKIALIVFPFIALIISMPFILIEYHKYGSISFFKGLVTYSFVLYFICAYFLIILPLPKISEVALLTTPRMQLIPFSFVVDFFKETSLNITNIHTYIKALTESCFYVPIYNLLLTLPFGIYLRYYFKCNLKKVILYTFLLSLFFELTQLSGLYFIYPRGYRLFDVDDLLLNTFGGVLGYLVSTPIIKILPKMEKVEANAKERGKKVSGPKRTTKFLLDLCLFILINVFVSFLIDSKYMFYIILVVYYFIIPIFLSSSTLGEKFLNLKVVDYEGNISIIRLIFRRFIFLMFYFGIPFAFIFMISNIKIENLKMIFEFIFIIIAFLFYAITACKYFFTNKIMLYEKLSKTKTISTIK